VYRRLFATFAVLVPAGIVAMAWFEPLAWWAFAVVGPILLVALHDLLQRRHSLLRSFPVIGHGRFLMEAVRPEIQQYFVESNIDGTPFSREFRSVIYQRAKGDRDTLPFGTQRDVRRVGYEWVNHSLAPKTPNDARCRINVGGHGCTAPYSASYLNVSAMSFGALSKNAIMALNGAAKQGGFAHNTGEGGLSCHHLAPGGDIIWQVGTGYFGCRTCDGEFDAEMFTTQSRLPVVKMIEIKLSQGAKPGHGGILPAAKVTQEIADIRGVAVGKDVISPPAHTAFTTPTGLLEFVAKLRELSGGKPVGFKLCLGHRKEFLGICKAMVETKLLPDFITVDGTEGGTGAAPMELSNSVGMPMRHGLRLVHNALRGIGVRPDIRIIAAGKVVTGFHMVRTMALGADMCNAARAMMFALGCIQARRCNANDCPVGVATQDPWRYSALNVADKTKRVAHYHASTIQSFREMLGVMGLDSPDQIQPCHLAQQVSPSRVKHFGEIYAELPEGALLESGSAASEWREDWQAASASRF